MDAADDHSEGVPWSAHRDVVEARRDPRLDYGREAVIADWWAALRAAERARRLADWGLHELQQALAREEERVGFSIGDVHAPDEAKQALKAAWERTHLALAESTNQMAEVNAMTLVTLVGALDALVETLTPGARELRLQMAADLLIRRAEEQASREWVEPSPLDDEMRVRLREAAARVLNERTPVGDRLYGVGVARWERVLRGAGLAAGRDRPIPEDLNEALCEVVALRHVIAHRASRVDSRALQSAPSLKYQEGDLVRITRADYRRYAAALRTYADEVIRRFMVPVGPVEVDLEGWRTNLPLNT